MAAKYSFFRNQVIESNWIITGPRGIATIPYFCSVLEVADFHLEKLLASLMDKYDTINTIQR
jgi:hypothetical protein